MMRALSVQFVANNNNGGWVVDALVVSDTTPSPLPTTGSGIAGLSANDTFAQGSMLRVIDTGDLYMANSLGVFIKQ